MKQILRALITVTLIQTGTGMANDVSPARVLQADAGAAEPSLLYIHGVYHGSWSFSELHPLLEATGKPQYLMDLRGHYGEARIEPDDPVGYADYAQDVSRILDDLPGNKVLIGHSLGGLLSMSMLHRDDVTGAVLISTPLPEVIRAKRWGLLFRHPIKSLSMVFRRDARFFYHNEDWARAYFFDETTSEATVSRAMARLKAQDEPFRLFDDINDLELDVEGIDKPVLVIHGAADPTVDRKAAEKLAGRFRVAPVTIEKAGHDLMLSPGHARQVATLIRRWLPETEESE